jgi:hypothetical protein
MPSELFPLIKHHTPNFIELNDIRNDYFSKSWPQMSVWDMLYLPGIGETEPDLYNSFEREVELFCPDNPNANVFDVMLGKIRWYCRWSSDLTFDNFPPSFQRGRITVIDLAL